MYGWVAARGAEKAFDALTPVACPGITLWAELLGDYAVHGSLGRLA